MVAVEIINSKNGKLTSNSKRLIKNYGTVVWLHIIQLPTCFPENLRTLENYRKSEC